MTDRGTEFCGGPEHHDYQLLLVVNDIEHTLTSGEDVLRQNAEADFA